MRFATINNTSVPLTERIQAGNGFLFIYSSGLCCCGCSAFQTGFLQREVFCLKKFNGARWCIYALGMVLLAIGITLNSLTGLGASAIVSVPFTVSEATGLSFGDLTLVVYVAFVIAEFFIMGKASSWTYLLQIPLSIVFTRIMNLIKVVFPYESGNLPLDLVMLVIAIILTGVGAAMTVDMALIPNPGDGIVASISARSGKELGLCKNIFDLCCMCCSLIIGTCMGNPLMGVGLGTLISMIGVGRVIAIFNGIAREKLRRMAGLEEAPSRT